WRWSAEYPFVFFLTVVVPGATSSTKLLPMPHRRAVNAPVIWSAPRPVAIRCTTSRASFHPCLRTPASTTTTSAFPHLWCLVVGPWLQRFQLSQGVIDNIADRRFIG